MDGSADAIGIGTATPSSLVEISSGTDGDAILTLSADTDNSNESDNAGIEFSQDGGLITGFIAFEGIAGTKATGTIDNAFILGSELNASDIQFVTNDNVRMTILRGGNIGIGTTSPTATLDVDGSAIFNESGADVDFRIEGDTKTHLFFVDASTDRVGIGISSPSHELDVNGTVKAYAPSSGGNVMIWASSDGARNSILSVPADGDATAPFIYSTNNAYRWLVDAINTLEINSNGVVTINQDGTSDQDFRVEGDTEENLLFVDASADKVGIGTSSPSATLDVRTASGSAAAAINLNTTGASSVGDGPAITFGHYASETAARISTYAVSTNSGHFLIETNSGSGLTERIRVQNDGYVGIGTSSPGYILTVNGQPGANGYTAFTNYSDRRLKTNIDSLENGALDKILQLNPVSFQYNDKYLQLYPESDLKRVHKGFIAQEIQKVFPEMVSEMKESPDSVQYLDLDISHLQVYLVKALQEQQAIIEAQKKEIETQKAELDTQKAENAAQEKEVEEVKAELDSKTSTNAEEIEALKAQVQQLLQLIQQQESVSVANNQ